MSNTRAFRPTLCPTRRPSGIAPFRSSAPAPLLAALLSLLGLLVASTALASDSPGLPEEMPAAAQGQDLSAPDQGVWVSIGNDALAALEEASFSFDHQPLRRHGSVGDVAITQLRRADLEPASELLHSALRRCGGYVIHDSLAQAKEALSRGHRNALGGAPIDYILDQEELVATVTAELTEASILQTIERLSTDFPNRYYQYPSGVAASSWIRDLWAGYANASGRVDVTVELRDHASWQQPSVVLTIPGTSKPQEIVVIGGHLDSITPQSGGSQTFSAPGADDNASGIAVISELARAAMVTDFRPQRTVKLMGYAAEEVGLLGSKEIAIAHREAGAEVVAVLQFDMTAFNGSSQDIALITDNTHPTLNGFVGNLIDFYLPDLLRTVTSCGYPCSDHASWHQEGFPAAMAFEAWFGQHNSTIHSSQDNLATLGNSAAHAFKFARLGAAFMVEIGVDVNAAIFANGFEEGTLDLWGDSLP